MASRTYRVSRVCNRHSPYRRSDAFGAAAAGACRGWASALFARVFSPRRPAPILTTGTPAMYVCSCKAITEAQVRAASLRARTPERLALALGLDDPSCCGRCFRDLDRLALIAADTIEEWKPEPALAR